MMIIIVNVALQESIKTSGQRQIWEKLRGAPKFRKMFPTKYVLGEVLMSGLQKALFTKNLLESVVINHRNPDFSTFLLSPDKKLNLSLVFFPTAIGSINSWWCFFFSMWFCHQKYSKDTSSNIMAMEMKEQKQR